ncbi:MAG: hypothetical protein ACFFC0_02385, partial [Promethearchaeota archaeon]
PPMGQTLGTFVGLITAFAIAFVILTLGGIMPEDLISSTIVNDFLSLPDLENRLVVVGTVLYPGPVGIGVVGLGTIIGSGAQGATVLMALAWGAGGLIAGLLTRDILGGILASLFAVVLGAFLTWMLVFVIQTPDFTLLFSGPSLVLLEAVLYGSLYPSIAAVIGGILGGGITRER